jgi:GDPmannose 4,6-dehydratase
LQLACLELGVELEFKGSGLDEVGIVKSVSSSEEINVKKNDILIRVSEKYFRPSEVETLLGDPSKAKSELGWKPKTSFKSLVSEMMQYDIRIAKERKILLNAR